MKGFIYFAMFLATFMIITSVASITFKAPKAYHKPTQECDLTSEICRQQATNDSLAVEVLNMYKELNYENSRAGSR